MITYTALMLALAALLAPHAFAAFPGTVNEYADQCACELGGGPGAYMPEGIVPVDNRCIAGTTPGAVCADDSTCGGGVCGVKEIPVTWNGKRITYALTDPGKCVGGGNQGAACATDANCPGGACGFEFLFDGMPGVKDVYPDRDNTVGRIGDKKDIKCDYFSHTVNKPPGGCMPGQRVLTLKVGDVRWTFIFRRDQPSRRVCVGGTSAGMPCETAANCTGAGATCPDPATWDRFHPNYFFNHDVNAFNTVSGGTCWFDTLKGSTGAGRGMAMNGWWMQAGLPNGIPRPGGRDTAKRARAAAFWDAPLDLTGGPGGPCTECHGSGPLIVSRWINLAGTLTAAQADNKPYWHAADLLPNITFFNTVNGGTNCAAGCHDVWPVEAATRPGEEISERETSEPMTPHASAYRLHHQCLGGVDADKACTQHAECTAPGKCRGLCDGGTANDMICEVDADCNDGMPHPCVPRIAGRVFEMPHPYNDTIEKWYTDVFPDYQAMRKYDATTNPNGSKCRVCTAGTDVGAPCTADADCPGGGAGSCPAIPAGAKPCDGLVRPKPPTFYGPQTTPVPADPKQLVLPPDPAKPGTFMLTKTNCVVAADGGEKCDYRVMWEDTENAYNAPVTYYLETAEGRNRGNTGVPTAAPYCPASNPPPSVDTPIAGSNWREKHTVDVAGGPIGPCTILALQLCGGHCDPPKESRNDGTPNSGFVSTACPPLDHFQCYEAHESPPNFMAIRDLSLDDDFGPAKVDVIRPKRFCNPVNKNGEDPTAPLARDHFVGYQIRPKARFARRKVTVKNQFGETTVKLYRPELLLVPTDKDLTQEPPAGLNPRVDHFKCYRAKGARERRAGIGVIDQFGPLTIDVKQPFRLCLPADKNHEGIMDPGSLLFCYKVRRAKASPKFVRPGLFFVKNQFGSTKYGVTRVQELCVPSTLVQP